MAEALDTQAALAAERDAEFFPLNDLPKELLVSVFAAVNDQTWVRHTFPLVCRAWNELYLSKDASPLHETLEVDFPTEVWRAKQERRRRVARSLTAEAAAQELASYRPVVHASRVISWAQGRAGSVRKLRFVSMYASLEDKEGMKDFSSGDLGTLVYVVRSSLTEIRISFYGSSNNPYEKQFWKSLRDFVAPAGRLRSLVVEGIGSALLKSDVEPLGQLAGSLEELVLETASVEEIMDDEAGLWGLWGFRKSLCALTELRRLKLLGHRQVIAIPAEISSLKKLEELELVLSNLSSLPKELGELSGLTKLDLSWNESLVYTLPVEEAFPAELGNMKCLRELELSHCRLRTVPSFIGGLKSLETLDLDHNHDLQIDATLDFLIEGCPRLRVARLCKGRGRKWTAKSLANLEAFKAKLRAKNPSALVEYKERA